MKQNDQESRVGRMAGMTGSERVQGATFLTVSPLRVGEGSGFDRLLLQRLGPLVTGRRRVARHAKLCREGDALELLYVVRYGQFKAVGEDSSGQQRVSGFQMAGDWMGLSAIGTRRHHLSFIALEDSEVVEIPLAAALAGMIAHPAVQYQFLDVLSEALYCELAHSMDMGNSLHSRFARFLLKLGKKYANLGYSSKSYRLSMSRADIGSYLGSTSESMSRVVARFNAQGIVTISGRNVEVHDPFRLDSLSRCLQPDTKRLAVH